MNRQINTQPLPTWATRLAPLSRVLPVLRQEGLSSLWFRVLGRTIYRRAILFERRLQDPIPDLQSDLPITIGLLEEAQIDEYRALQPEADAGVVRQRLNSGQQCFVVWHAGHIVHACWAVARRAWIAYLAREIELAPDQVYVGESLTAPAFRGHNLAGARSAYLARTWRDAGYRRLIAIVVPENKPALRPTEKMGYRPIGVIGYWKLGPWRRDFCHMRQA